MAEPVWKCAGCRLRVQGVRQLDDGLSYCATCVARIEEQALALDDQTDEQHEDAAPEAEATLEEPQVTSTVSPENPAAPEDAPAISRQVRPPADRGTTMTGSGADDAFTQALARERANLFERRKQLESEIHRLEEDIQAISRRVDHVDALLEPEAASEAA